MGPFDFYPILPITSQSYVDYIRKQLYKRLDPYKGYKIMDQLKDLSVKTEKDAPQHIDDAEMNDLDRETADEIFAAYFNIPKTQRRYPKSDTLYKSKYSPTKGKSSDKYYALKLSDFDKEMLMYYTDNLKFGQNDTSEVFANKNLGVHTVGKGIDPKRGEYRSYYDRWDLNPLSGKYGGIDVPLINKLDDISMGIGTPINIYDRLYLDDYYGVNSGAEPGTYYGGYIPEVTVTPEDELDRMLKAIRSDKK